MADKKLKLMQVIGAKNSGGAELFYLRLARALAKRDDVELLCVVRQGSWMQKQLEAEGLNFKTAPFGGFFDRKTTKILKSYIDDFQPDVVQGWMSRACSKLPKTSVPTVGRLGGYYPLKNFKNCDHLIGNTQELKRYIIENGHPAAKTHYIPNFAPIPDERFKLNRADVRYEFGIAPEVKVLFIAGRLHPVKGIDLAIHALRGLPEHVHLMVAGSGKMKRELESLAEKEGVADRVHLLGWVNNITVVASAADIWLVPSRQEALGNVVLDAWAHGVPVVASKTPGPMSLIEDDLTGKLFDIEDVDTMVRHVEALLKSPRHGETMAENAKSVMLSNYSEESVLKKFISFYKGLI